MANLLDFPIPLSTGIAWLRLPYPLSVEDLESVRKIALWNLEEMKRVLIKEPEEIPPESDDGE